LIFEELAVIEVDKKDFVQTELPEQTIEETPTVGVVEKNVEATSASRPNSWLLLIIGLLVGGLGGF